MPEANPTRDVTLYQRTVRKYDLKNQFYFLRRGQPIDVMRYLPKFLKKEPEFLKIQDALSREHEKLKEKAMDIVRQFFVETATWGLNSWERIFEVTPPRGAGYELRRSLIKAKMAGWAVMTKERSEWLMNQFVIGKDGYIIELPEPGVLEMVIPSSTDYHRAMWRALDEMIPYHLAFHFLYTVYGDLEDDEAANMKDDGDGDFLGSISLGWHDIIPYGTNVPILSRDGTVTHGWKACRNGHFIRGGRGLSKKYPRIVPPAHHGWDDLSTDSLSYWPVWIGEENIPVRETLPENLGMALSIEDRAEVRETLSSALLFGFHEIVPYGTERPVFSRDGIHRHSAAARRDGTLARAGRAFHGMQTTARLQHGEKRDLERERHFFAIGYSFEETIKAQDEGRLKLFFSLPADKVPRPKEGDAGLEARLILRRDGSIRHDGKFARGVSPAMSGDFELVRSCRNGKMARGGSAVHRGSPLDWPT